MANTYITVQNKTIGAAFTNSEITQILDATKSGTKSIKTEGLLLGSTNTLGIGTGEIGLLLNSKVYLGDLNTYIVSTSTGHIGIGTNKLQVPVIHPSVDSTTAIQFNKADSTTNVITIDTTNSRLGIGTVAPSSSLSFSGTSATTISLDRNTTAATAGQTLTINAGGAYLAGTNLAGGNLLLKAGISTGTGTSSIIFYTAPAGSSGTADNAPTEKMRIDSVGNVGIGLTPTASQGTLQVSGSIRTTGYTVATLPAGTVGMVTYVTDATSKLSSTILTGGGSYTVPVFYNGTNWKVYTDDATKILSSTQALHRGSQNINDIFIYDTTKDDDSGNWTKNTLASWYNETLAGKWLGYCLSESAARLIPGATTGDYYQYTDSNFYKLNAGSGTTQIYRGNKAEFPTIAALVACTNNVIVYDLTEPNNPMWGVINNKMPVSSSNVSCVYALNGEVTIGVSSGYVGVFVVDLVKDYVVWSGSGASADGSGTFTKELFTCSDTNKFSASLTYHTTYNASVYRFGTLNAIYSVVMVKAKEAPMEISGLTAPTVIVGTATGVKVLHNNGTVVSSLDSSIIIKVGADKNVLSWITASGLSYVAGLSTLGVSFAATGSYDAISGPAILGTPTCYYHAGVKLIGSASGLTLIKDSYTKANSMSAFITNTYNTGYMIGDTKRCYIADAGTNGTVNGVATISSLFASGEQGVWFDASDATDYMSSRTNSYAYHSGTATDFFYASDASVGNVTGDITIVWVGEFLSLTYATAGRILDKVSVGLMVISNGKLRFYINSGTYTFESSVTLASVISRGQKVWLKVQKAQANTYAQFFYSFDGITYTQLGTDITVADSAGTIATSTALLTIGGRQSAPDYGLNAKTYDVEIYAGIGTDAANLRADFDPQENLYSSTSWKGKATGETWVISGNAYVTGTYAAAPTLYQDSGATTPVTSLEKTVGLMLDKSKGVALGAELVTNGTFDTDISGWSLISGNAVLSRATDIFINGAIKFVVSDSVYSNASQTIPVTPLKKYIVSYRHYATVGAAARVIVWDGATASRIIESLHSSSGSIVDRYFYITPTQTYVRFSFDSAGPSNGTQQLDNISIKEITGNYAYQETSTKRPVLSARYNLLTKTEDYSDAVWAKTNSTINSNTIVSPNGTITADTINETAVIGAHSVYLATSPVTISSTNYTNSLYIKSNGRTKCNLSFVSASSPFEGINLSVDLLAKTITPVINPGGSYVSGTIIELSDSWFFISVTGSVGTKTNGRWYLGILDDSGSGSYLGDITKGFYIWGADLRVANDGSNLPAYQRVNTATDYDPVGFPAYLKFDGVDDCLVTNSIDFSATDEMSVFAGVRKLSDAAIAFLAELSLRLGSYNGAFYLAAPANISTGNFAFSTKGTIQSTAVTGNTFAAPITNVLTGLSKISTDSVSLRVNGTQVASSSSNQGTGNYGNYPLYIGMREGTSYPFNGRINSLIIRGKTTETTILPLVENYVNLKTRAYTLTTQLNDRSYKKISASIYGFITSTAINNIISYSNFFFLNYIREIYSSDLDFSTNSFYYECWFKTSALGPQNLLTYSEDFSNVAYTVQGLTQVANTITSPDGTLTADAVYETATTSAHLLESIATYSLTANVTYTLSARIKANGRTKGRIYIYNTASPNNESSISFDLNSLTPDAYGFCLVTSSVTPTISVSTYVIRILLKNDVNAESYLGDITKGFYIWGAHLSTSSSPRPYTKTTSAAVTSGTSYLIDRSYTTGPSYKLGYNTTGNLVASIYDGTTTRTVTSTQSYNTNNWIKATVTYSAGTVSLYVNGSKVGSSTGTALLTLDNTSAELTIGSSYDLISYFVGDIAQVKISAALPTDNQISYAYSQEKQMFRSDVSTVLPDSNTVSDVSYDETTNKYVVASALNESTWSGLVRVATSASVSNSINKVATNSTMKVISNSPNYGANVTLPAGNLIEMLYKSEIQKTLSKVPQSYWYTGTGSLNTFSLPIGYEIKTITVNGALLKEGGDYTVTYDGFIQTATLTVTPSLNQNICLTGNKQ